MKTGINNLTKDELQEAEDAIIPWSFEKYCGTCDNFPGDLGEFNKRERYGEKCPFRKKFLSGEYNGDTQWKTIGCNEFWD